jgi:hypothetical protein
MSREAIKNVPPFSGEESISPWGWVVVGGVISATMGLGAWFLLKSYKFGSISTGESSPFTDALRTKATSLTFQ